VREQKRIGIVGGGILGMGLALRLSEKGFRVTLLEGTDEVGGLTKPCAIGDYTWDRFYHVILKSDTYLLDLLEQLRLSRALRWRRPKTGLLADGHIYSVSNIFEFLRFPPLGLADKIRFGLSIIHAARVHSYECLERVKAVDWLISHSGRKNFQKIWLPLLRSKLGRNDQVVSASFITGIIARLYAAKRSRLKEDHFGYVEGGYREILHRLQELLVSKGVEVRCKERPDLVTSNDGKVHLRSELSNMKALEVDAVVLTVSCPEILWFCQDLSPTERKRLQRVRYQSLVCVTVLLKKPLSRCYMTNITDSWVPFTGVIEMTNVMDSSHFGGNSLVYLPRYLAPEDPLLGMSDGAVVDEFISALKRVYAGIQEKDILALRLSRAAHALPLMTVNYSSECLLPTRTTLKNVFVANSTQISKGTMNVNEILGLAIRKSSEIERDMH